MNKILSIKLFSNGSGAREQEEREREKERAAYN
jgi:hypothetical protein